MVGNLALWLLAAASLLLGQATAERKTGTAGAPAQSAEVVARIEEAGKVFSEIMSAPDKAIPEEILSRAHCIGIIPGMKRAGFIVGGQYGKGVLTCRTNGSWSGPSTIRIEGGSFGAQIGGGETDVVLVVMNERGAEKLMGNEFTFGADAAAMAGPVGREAAAKTDAVMRAQILSYSRSRGLFAGVTLNGSTLRSDDEDNAKLYGRPVSHKEILMGKVPPPKAAAPLYASLKRHMPARAGEASRDKK
jgi:lipid-binding SYLF domain-containing protein